MYQYETNVRYTEVTNTLCTPVHQIINYFQDCSIMDSEMIGKGLSYLEQQKKGWVLTAWQIDIKKIPAFRQRITVRTWPYAFKGIYGYRNFDILDEQGNPLVQANSLWCLMDMESARPVKLAAEDIDGYVLQPPLPMQQVSRKLPVYEEGVWQAACDVRRQDIDTNCHVNNARYLAYAEEYLPDAFCVRQVRVQYKSAAKYGDTLYPVVSRLEAGYSIRLCDAQRKPYVIMEFLEEA